MGGSPSPKATVYGPTGHNRRSRAACPGFDGVELGATRGIPPLCSAQGYCAAPRSPRGPPRWRRELVPRGAARRGTDAGLMAGLIECALNPLCVCGCWSSAPTRVKLVLHAKQVYLVPQSLNPSSSTPSDTFLTSTQSPSQTLGLGCGEYRGWVKPGCNNFIAGNASSLPWKKELLDHFSVSAPL